uniref:Mitochondrial import inner membrane translocase subunit n=1 Tax=Elaeis guineensis var. tenera TaxID=51953 RepID=A0A6I9RRA9_ELAGV|nr:mitochondrial import inner membrane translocase subunit TIM10 isoform X1 [Elaeis guineensis]XP_010931163.1 mitochondrial import inner membrane translocase subunit TIM10 isoform X1 [Elaeis guineensis]
MAKRVLRKSSSSYGLLQIFGMAEQEMEYRVDLFNRLTKLCFDKCIDKRYKETELNMGENSCIDRCVSKYWQVIAWSNQMPDHYELLEEFSQAVNRTSSDKFNRAVACFQSTTDVKLLLHRADDSTQLFLFYFYFF